MLISRLFSKNLSNVNFLIKNNYFCFSKIIPIRLPDLGEGTKEAIVRKWLKKEGEKIEEEEIVAEVYTDKLVAEIPSPGKGKVHKINYKIEEPCLVGKILCEIEVEEAGEVKTEQKEKNEEKVELKLEVKIEEKVKVEEHIGTPQMDAGLKAMYQAELERKEPINEMRNTPNQRNKILATPAVRFLIKQSNIDQSKIQPTGKGNRVMKHDVLNYLSSLTKKEVLAKISCPEAKKTVVKPAVKAQVAAPELDQIVKIIGFQKTMAKTMTESNKIPSFLYTDEFNVDKLVKLRKEMNNIEKGKFKFTFMPFFVKAVSLALKEYPQLNSVVNSTLGEDGYISEYTIKKDHNISIAIDSSEGLVVPNLKRVQEKTIMQIQREINELRDKVESRKLSSDDLRDGTFTLSNIGNIGGKVLSPMVLPPQTCIIGISKIFDSIAVVPKVGDYDDVIVHELASTKDLVVLFRKSVNLCISADHRIIDGATVARFFETLKFYIENPLKIWTSS